MATRVLPKKPNAKMKLEGFPELQASLAETMTYARGKQIKMEVYLPAGEQVRAALIEAAPKGTTPPPENWLRIRDAIWLAPGADKYPNVLVGINTKKAPQARWVEYGTQPRQTKSGKSTGKVEARPFWRPTMRKVRPQIIRYVANGWREQMTKPTNFQYGDKPW